MTQKQWNNQPPLTIATKKTYQATIDTIRGKIELELNTENAPLTVNNFVFLAREGFYNGISFHRVINNFMIQGGDPTGTGSGGPGYKFADEVFDNKLTHEIGVISMANAGPNTNGSQFFITFGATPHLNGGDTIFGQVVKGMDTVNALTRRDPSNRPDFVGDVMESVTIIEA